MQPFPALIMHFFGFYEGMRRFLKNPGKSLNCNGQKSGGKLLQHRYGTDTGT